MNYFGWRQEAALVGDHTTLGRLALSKDGSIVMGASFNMYCGGSGHIKGG